MVLCRNSVVSEWCCVGMALGCVTLSRVTLFTVTIRGRIVKGSYGQYLQLICLFVRIASLIECYFLNTLGVIIALSVSPASWIEVGIQFPQRRPLFQYIS